MLVPSVRRLPASYFLMLFHCQKPSATNLWNLPLNYNWVPNVTSLCFKNLWHLFYQFTYRHKRQGFLYFSILAKVSYFSTPKCPLSNLCLTSFVAGRRQSGNKKDGKGLKNFSWIYGYSPRPKIDLYIKLFNNALIP